MKNRKAELLLLAGMALSSAAFSQEKVLTVSLGADALAMVRTEMGLKAEQINSRKGYGLISLPESLLPRLSVLMHEQFGRCGGFMHEDDPLKTALDWQLSEVISSPEPGFYRISQENIVTELMAEVREEEIRYSIETLSGFRNRYCRSPHGKASQEWVRDKWLSLSASLGDRVSVTLVNHSGYSQPSVVLTWRGSELPDEEVILGGHGDSIAGWFPDNNVLAPGADDNASGISTLTETLRVLAQGGFNPRRTIRFMSYAAEEVGLKGSAEIAANFRREGRNVKGVMQLDMTNYAAADWDMVLITDHTNAAQNEFVARLIGTYLPGLRWKEDQCGYACSDHASWNRNGYPVSFPFEAPANQRNNYIHTAQDTLALSDYHALHAVPFAKLALAFLVELAGD